jgi:hypothetical protein
MPKANLPLVIYYEKLGHAGAIDRLSTSVTA